MKTYLTMTKLQSAMESKTKVYIQAPHSSQILTTTKVILTNLINAMESF